MLYTFPATFTSDSFIGSPFQPFDPGFPPWDFHEPAFLSQQEPEQDQTVVISPQPSQEPVTSNSGSDTSNPSPVPPNSGSDEPNRNPRSGSDVVDERKRKRMISNRESARRSRMRKQRHLENLKSTSNRLKIANRELMNGLRLTVHQNQLVRRENDCLRAEAVLLRQRLWDIRQVLLVRQLQQHLNTSAWPCINPTTSTTTLINDNEGQQMPHHSLIA